MIRPPAGSLPRMRLGIAGETLTCSTRPRTRLRKSGMDEKMQSGDPNDIFDAAEAVRQVVRRPLEGARTQAVLPTYKMLIESAKPPLPEDARALALEVAESPGSGVPANGPSGHQAGWSVRLRAGRGDGDRSRSPGLAGRPAVAAADEAGPVPARRDRHRLEGHLGTSIQPGDEAAEPSKSPSPDSTSETQSRRSLGDPLEAK